MSDLVEDFVARYRAMRHTLPGDEARENAARSFARGLPTMRDEAWHYTSLRPLGELTFAAASDHADATALLARAPRIDAPRLVFVAGRLRDDLSVRPDADGVSIGGASFGALARPQTERLVALNTMLAEDGATMDVAAGVDGGAVVVLSLAPAAGGTPIAFHPRHRVRLAAGATLTLIEVSIGDGTYLHNPVWEIEVAEGATLTHLRLQDEAAEAFHLSTLYADIAARGTYDSFALTLGGRLARLEVHARLGGPRAAAHLNAAQLLGGRQHADFTTVVAHDAPSCASRQTVKNVLTGRSRGVFQGRIEVARVAQKTDGYQMTQALLLSPHAEIDSKPQLQIYADDVKCSHGCTVGELSPDQLFYLRSRGIAEADARAMLVRAFLTEALDPIAHQSTRAAMEAAVDAWWTRHAA
ncbi:MAG: Fe-S cluster assembly protein SufD [Acidisphaera sp.]|nr:Fe-S cluster assembly protein SufD [Acidisphaera sp.]